jgi:hypothetical protein
MKKSKTIKIIIIIGALALILPTLPGLLYLGMFLVFGTEDRTFESVWFDGFHEADKILVANGLCPTNKVCSQNSVSIFAMGIPKGFQVEIYGTSDHKLLEELSMTFTKKFTETPSMKHLTVHAYAFTRQEAGNFPFIKEWSEGSILKIDVRRKP